MTNLLQLVQAWKFQPLFYLFNFIYLFYFKFFNVLTKSSINDGGLALSLSITSINNGGFVKTLKHPLTSNKPMLGELFQCFHLYLNSTTLLCKKILSVTYHSPSHLNLECDISLTFSSKSWVWHQYPSLYFWFIFLKHWVKASFSLKSV